ncbi:hypothetical protein I8752_15040 [Nostocaceae cyanobacterium CENA369]|uniref:Uncharacterized protein n=1 Tax=Dendronalium phyllosphericum CENA369 TaxID=1725256 RepID=A0A8J7I703_9NOST|nr:hypothetical protein [Dendronalium phyllosphericum]MBH8574310.1 hypothetical protein [Dendronalium phyllosphericum CENA369]
MEHEYYKQYLHFKTVGLHSEAKQTLQQFIVSFASIAEKEKWTREFLEAKWSHHRRMPGDSIRN